MHSVFSWDRPYPAHSTARAPALPLLCGLRCLGDASPDHHVKLWMIQDMRRCVFGVAMCG
jgi:hypothetical protein